MIYREATTKVNEQVRAIEKVEGYPKKPSHVGAAFVRAGLVPDVYVPGAIGWTEKLTNVVDVGGGESECEIPDEVIARTAGRDVVLDGKTVRIAVVSKAVAGGRQTP